MGYEYHLSLLFRGFVRQVYRPVSCAYKSAKRATGQRHSAHFYSLFKFLHGRSRKPAIRCFCATQFQTCKRNSFHRRRWPFFPSLSNTPIHDASDQALGGPVVSPPHVSFGPFSHKKTLLLFYLPACDTPVHFCIVHHGKGGSDLCSFFSAKIKENDSSGGPHI